MYRKIIKILRYWLRKLITYCNIKIYRLRKVLSAKQSSSQPIISNLIFNNSDSSGVNKWIFHDEDWVRVIHRREHRCIVAAGRPLQVIDNWQEPTDEVAFKQDGIIHFNGKTKNKDEWLYLFLDPIQYNWKDYCWKFRIRRYSQFREFQFGFRYQDFYNRYRYRFENNHIFFDIAIKGKFHNRLGECSFEMKLGVWYDVEIYVFGNNFKCYVNKTLMLNDYDFSNNFPMGSITLILWENNGKTDIKASVGPMSIYEIESPKINEIE